MNDIELGVHAPSHASAASDEILTGGIPRNTNGHALSNTPVLADVLIFHVSLEAAVYLLGDLAKCEFAKSDEISAAKKVLERALHFFRAVNVAALHAVVQCFRSQVDHDGFR